ncbi:hypothetical protein TTHERM_00658830 (macronuclear) [Tetrahymena thermophila SB210]|uniref:Uncharacterized protein n=1 Tax=Tetrahymena thermophila (strain SB210) TaxID=312017 RepID=I7M3P3_TETTS|nr:hypothetical protein TTHERM_00658830 [Tetrahymena thermophila SB210]EAS03839.1 hypothetical protein TTHERM_00658830 [Tetrahymena thermophila SB210]|eukprot:XP_001024084.1 hypothetical protein TTHERM_00658830 [Tetrahymena thermophila SB210]
MGCLCCCCKKPQPVKIEEKVEPPIDIQALLRKYAHLVTEWVVQENETEILKIINEGFSPDLIFDAGGYETTILILTIAFKKDKLTQAVLNYPQNLNVVVKPNNDSALVMAISHRNVHITQLLLQKGANRNILGPEGKSLVELATKQLNQCKESNDEQGVQVMGEIKNMLQSYLQN